MTQDFAKPSTTRVEKKAPKQTKGSTAGRARKPKPAQTKKNIKPSASATTKNTNSAPKPAPTMKFNSIFKGSTIKIALLVLLVGIAAYGLLLLNKVPPSPPVTINKIPQSATKKPSNKAQSQKPSSEIKKFDFYVQLPKASITPSKESISHYKPKSKDGEPYLKYLQVGSFRQKNEAEAQKAKIALLGIRAEVRETKTASGTIWYKVETLPYNSRSKLNGAIDKLVNINIEPLEKKAKQ
jgi:cell division protein FtsN